MQLVHTEITLGFKGGIQLQTPARRVFSALGGKIPRTKPEEPGVRIRDEEKRIVVKWNYEQITIVSEERKDLAGCIDSVLHFLEVIDSVAPLEKVKGVELLSSWILPMTQKDFSSLNTLYVDKMMQHNEFTRDHNRDSSVVLDTDVVDFMLHHQSGPMGSKQLLEKYLVFEMKEVPRLFMFLMVGALHSKVIKYSKELMNEILRNASNHCLRHSNNFAEIWR